MNELKMNEFTELSQDEMMQVEGGYWETVLSFFVSPIINFVFFTGMKHLYNLISKKTNAWPTW